MSAMTGFLDWAGRVVMLVLAGMITLSIIGAIAAIPSGTVQTRMGMEPRAWPEPRPIAEPQPVPAQPQTERIPPATSAPAPQAGTVLAPARKEPVDPAGWLEAITYALLALVGAVVFAIVLLWRAVGHWRRSADALEEMASRGSTI
jgi:hypothetical protein